MPRWALLLGAVALTVAAFAGCGEQDASPGPTPSPEPAATETIQPSPSATPLGEARTTPSPSSTPSDPDTTPTRTSTPAPTARPGVTPTPTPAREAAEPGSFRYDTYDTTGAVTTPGSYAFLSDPDDTTTAVTTYEALRDGTTTALLIHTSDTHGASQAALYDAVEMGHLIEWSKAADCFVRYRVTDVPAADAAAAHREFGVRWETYVFQGCQTGSLPTSATVKFTAAAELPLKHNGGASLTDFAVVHGPWQLTPYAQPAPGAVGSPAAGIALKGAVSASQPERFRTPATHGAGDKVTSLVEARRLPYWRDPSLPEGWTFSHLWIGGVISRPGFEAVYLAPGGRHPAVSFHAVHAEWRYLPEAASWLTNHSPSRRVVQELRVIANRAALVQYSPLGAQHHPSGRVSVLIYDDVAECIYWVEGRSGSLGLRGGPAALERVLAIAASLFESPNAP